MANGLTSTGFGVKPLSEILDDLATDQKAEISNELNTSPTSVLGVLNGIFAERLYELWTLGQAIYNSFNPDAAEGTSLDNISSISGTLRQASTKSTVTLTLGNTGGAGSYLVEAGAVVAVVGTGEQFVTDSNVYIPGSSTVDVAATAVNYGAVVGNAGTITEKISSATGWDTVTNANDATLGLEEETDAELRVSRQEGLAIAGTGTFESMRSDLLDVTDVTEVLMFENFTNVTDGNGLPPKSFEAVILGGAAQDIADKIWETKPCGIEPHGDETQAITDSQGGSHNMKYTIPSVVDIYVEVTVVTDSDVYATPNDCIDDVKAAIVAYGNTLGIGDNVVAWKVSESIGNVEGITDVTTILLDDVDPPVGTTNITIDTREISSIDTSDVDVNAS